MKLSGSRAAKKKNADNKTSDSGRNKIPAKINIPAVTSTNVMSSVNLSGALDKIGRSYVLIIPSKRLGCRTLNQTPG